MGFSRNDGNIRPPSPLSGGSTIQQRNPALLLVAICYKMNCVANPKDADLDSHKKRGPKAPFWVVSCFD